MYKILYFIDEDDFNNLKIYNNFSSIQLALFLKKRNK